MVETLINNTETLNNVGLVGFCVGTIIFQWWLIIHLYRENKNENKKLVEINNNIIKEFWVLTEGVKTIAESNAKINDRIDYYFIKK